MSLLTDIGEEFIMDQAFNPSDIADPTDLRVGLYSSSDSLTETSDIGDTTTEPATTDTNYTRNSLTYDDNTVFQFQTDGSGKVILPDQSFDTTSSNHTQTGIDRYFIVGTFDSDVAGDAGTEAEHLLWTGSLNTSFDLPTSDPISVSNMGGSLT